MSEIKGRKMLNCIKAVETYPHSYIHTQKSDRVWDKFVLPAPVYSRENCGCWKIVDGKN